MKPGGFVYARLGQKNSAINANDDNDNDDR